LLGNQGEKGRLLKLHRETLLQRVVKYAVTGLVDEIGEDDGVFICQAGGGVARADVHRSPERGSDEDHGGGNKNHPAFS
jgi:hypothetical protein